MRSSSHFGPVSAHQAVHGNQGEQWSRQIGSLSSRPRMEKGGISVLSDTEFLYQTKNNHADTLKPQISHQMQWLFPSSCPLIWFVCLTAICLPCLFLLSIAHVHTPTKLNAKGAHLYAASWWCAHDILSNEERRTANHKLLLTDAANPMMHQSDTQRYSTWLFQFIVSSTALWLQQWL